MDLSKWIVVVFGFATLAVHARDSEGDEVRSSGEYYKAAKDWTGGIAAFESLLREKPANWGKDSDAEAAALWFLAEFYKGAKQVDQAERRYEQAMLMRERRREFHIAAFAAADLGLIRHLNGKHVAAVKAYEKALAWRIKVNGENSLEAAQQHHNIGIAARTGEDYARAGIALVRSYEIRTAKLSAKDPLVFDSLEALGEHHAHRGDVKKAIEFYLKARETASGNSRVEPRRLANLEKLLAEEYAHLNDHKNSEACLRRAFEIYDANDPASAAMILHAMCNRAIHRGQYVLADTQIVKYRNYCRERLPENHAQHAWVDYALGSRYMADGRFEDAEAAFRNAVVRQLAANGGRPFNNSYQLRMSLAKSLSRMGRRADSDAEYGTALTECERFNGPNGLSLGGALWEYAIELIDAKRYDEAHRHLERAASIWDKPDCQCHY